MIDLNMAGDLICSVKQKLEEKEERERRGEPRGFNAD